LWIHQEKSGFTRVTEKENKISVWSCSFELSERLRGGVGKRRGALSLSVTGGFLIPGSHQSLKVLKKNWQYHLHFTNVRSLTQAAFGLQQRNTEELPNIPLYEFTRLAFSPAKIYYVSWCRRYQNYSYLPHWSQF
jgi:hypothetical protein